ncbi:transmembrane protein 242 isoform X3 [Temnothorax nylanderi]|uniref:transmembrane protein 242 isoform X3 n=1 Tax=Temnothorax nylanderi TaxID=102681 RepID=UPI003A8A98FE
MAESNDTVETSITKSAKRREKIYAAVFLSTVAGISALAGFARAVAATRKQDPTHFGDGISGCGLFFYGIWKISGATNAEEFKLKMGSVLPKIPKNNPPQSRTEFEGLTDLLTYISEDWGRNKEE